MKIESRVFEKLGEILGLDEKKGYGVAIAFVLLFVVVLVAGFSVYVIAWSGTPEGYSTLYLLSSEKTLDLPETVVIGQNNTFQVWAIAENHMRETLHFEIRVKITQEADPTFPVNSEPESSYSATLGDGEKSEQLATVTIDEIGWHMVVFELWSYKESAAKFTGNVCVLNIEAIS